MYGVRGSVSESLVRRVAEYYYNLRREAQMLGEIAPFVLTLDGHEVEKKPMLEIEASSLVTELQTICMRLCWFRPGDTRSSRRSTRIVR